MLPPFPPPFPPPPSPRPPILPVFCVAERKKKNKGKKESVLKQKLLKASHQCLERSHDYRLGMIIGCEFRLTIRTKINCFNTTLKVNEI